MKKNFKSFIIVLFISFFLTACVEDGDPIKDPDTPAVPPTEQGPPVDLPENMEPEDNK